MLIHLSQLNRRPAVSRRSKAGTVLAATLVVVLAFTLVLAGLLGWVNTESRINRLNLLQTKAQYAAESTSEYALAQMRCILKQKPVYPANLFTPGVTPPTAPTQSLLGSLTTSVLPGVTGSTSSGFATNITSSLSTLQNSVSNDLTSRFVASNATIRAGSFSAERRIFIDPNSVLYRDDPDRGKFLTVQEVRVLCSAKVTDRNLGESKTAYVEQVLQIRKTSFTGFGAFYNVLMEIAPGASMSMYGPVHSNRDIYVQSSAGLGFFGVVSTAGNIYHGRAPGNSSSTDSGDVTFINSAGSSVNMKQGSTWVDSRVSNWLDQSSALWGTNVMTGISGITTSMPANIPPYVPDNPATTANELVNAAHLLIDPATKVTSTSYQGDDTEIQKFVAQASLVFTVSSSGTVKAYKYKSDPSGDYVRATNTGAERVSRVELTVPTGLVVGGSASAKFYDYRRAKWTNVVDIDVSKLRSVIENDSNVGQWTMGSNTFSPATEWNGVVYVEDADTSSGSIRLVNGGRLPSRPTTANDNAIGFTIATNVPAYIKGNYNADGVLPTSNADIRNYETNEVPAGIAADAITILSTNWNDANSSSALSSRTATPTEVSAAFITGVVPTNRQNNAIYSGGLENLPRFLENWSGVKCGYRGSLIVLFESQFATEAWGSSNVYNAPNRVWGYNKLFEEGYDLKGLSRPVSFRRLSFRHLSPDEYQAALSSL